MKYYLHDSNSFNDEKITELYINFGYEGLGLFYTVLEKLSSQEKPIKTDVLKHQLNVGKKLNKCWKFMEDIGILSSNNGDTFNKQLLNFSEKYKIKKENNAKRISQWRDNQKDTENVTRYESVRNATKVKESKVKESKVKESKVKEIKKEIFDSIFLTDKQEEEVKNLFKDDYLEALERLSNYKNSFDVKYESDYHVLIGWVKKSIFKEKSNGKPKTHEPRINRQTLSEIQRSAEDWGANFRNREKL